MEEKNQQPGGLGPKFLIWLVIGAAVGTVIGVITGNLAIWVAIGAGVGMLFGLFARSRRTS